MIYFLIYLFLLLCGFGSNKNRALQKLLYYLCLISLFLFVGFRYRVGCDWWGYLSIFEKTRRYESPGSNEAGFWMINRLLHDFDLEYAYINVFASAMFFLGLDTFARRQPDRIAILALAFPILILNIAMSGIRQAIAVGFLCFAFNAFVDKHLVRYVLFIMVAYTFHHSSAVFLALAPFVRGEFTRGRAIIGGIIALPALYVMLNSQAYEMYSQRYFGTATEAFGAPFRTGLLALTGIAFLFFLDSKWRTFYKKDYKLVKLTAYLLVAVFPISFMSSVIGDRFGYYLCLPQILILTRAPRLVPRPYSNMVTLAPYAVLGLTLLTWITMSTLFSQCYLPYQIWW